MGVRLMQVQSRVLLLAAIVWIFPKSLPAEPPISWQANVDAARRLAVQTNRPMLIHFWADWCRPCQRMQQQVFSRPEVARAIEQHFVPVKINVDHLPYTAHQYGVTALPTDVVVAPNGKVIAKFVGAPSASRYLAQLQQVAPRNSAPSAGRSQLAAAGPTHPGFTTGNAVPVTGTRTPATGLPPGVGTAAPVMGSQPPISTNNLAAAQAAQTASQPVWGPLGTQVNQPTQRPSVQPSPTNAWNRPVSQPSPQQYASLVPQQGPSPMSASPAMGRPAQPAGNVGGSQVAIPTGGPPVMAMNMNAAAPSTGSPSSDRSRSNVTDNGNRGIPPALSPPTTPANQPGPAPSETTTAGVSLPPGNPPLGLDGYCPVQLTDHQRWVPGDPRWGLIHEGRTYLFAGPEERDRFDADPQRYAPALSGCDVVLAVEQGKLTPGKREFGAWFEGRVYLFSSQQTLQQFDRDPQRYITALSRLSSSANAAASGAPAPSLPSFNGASRPTSTGRF